MVKFNLTSTASIYKLQGLLKESFVFLKSLSEAQSRYADRLVEKHYFQIVIPEESIIFF
jgi:hypothetical protein